MLSLYLIVAATVVYWAASKYSRLQTNIAEAKRSGVPYIVTPITPTNIFVYLFHKHWAPLVRLLPRSWWQEWLEVVNYGSYWKTKHAHFDKHGGMFLLVSPQGNQLMLANAEVIHQVMGNLDRFPKDIERYGIMRHFGENLLTADVATWRVHRKLTSGSFNEQNAALVFREATRQSKGMIKLWTDSAGKPKKTIRTLENDTNRLALHIIGYVGFGLSLLWPGETLPEDASPKVKKYGSLTASPGHVLSFADTVQILLEKITTVFLLPARFLKLLPSDSAKLAAQSYEDFTKYLSELLDEKTEQARKGGQAEVGMDFMGHLARSSNELEDGAAGKESQRQRLSRDEIIGNAFIMLVAGHETSANVLHFSILELATNPASQRRLQKDIDELLGDRDPETWEYENVVNKLMASMPGAVMNEVLRLIPPVVDMPKKVSDEHDAIVTMNGKQYTLPKSTGVSVLAVSAHRNPQYWRTQPSKIHPGKTDVDDFVPERWLLTNEDSKLDDGQAPEDAVTSAQLYRPPSGSFIPFSAGARSCIGRRIAQVEIVAMLAVLFQKYSVELALDEWASDEEVSKMSKEEATKVYAKAQKKSRETLENCASVLTLKLQRGQHVPVRLVKRGEERFVNWLEMEK